MAITIPADLTIVTLRSGGGELAQRWTDEYATAILSKASDLLKSRAAIEFSRASIEVVVEEMPSGATSETVDEAGERHRIGDRHLNDLELTPKQVAPCRDPGRDRGPDPIEQGLRVPEYLAVPAVVQAGRPGMHEPPPSPVVPDEPDGHPARGGIDVKQVGVEQGGPHEPR